MKRLFLDIETSPNLGLFWRSGFKVDIMPEAIVQERAIICACWAWEHDEMGSYHSTTWDKNQDDKKLCEKVLSVCDEADEIVGHYIKGFDIPWIRTRCLFHGIPQFPTYKMVDTKELASRHFYFNSDKLDYISKFLGSEGKIKTDYQMWKDIMLHNDKKQLKRMVEYNGGDVTELRKVFNKIQMSVPHATHVGVEMGGPKWSCPRDGSENVRHSKKRITAAGTVKHQMQCQECGGYFPISALDYRGFSTK